MSHAPVRTYIPVFYIPVSYIPVFYIPVLYIPVFYIPVFQQANTLGESVEGEVLYARHCPCQVLEVTGGVGAAIA